MRSKESALTPKMVTKEELDSWWQMVDKWHPDYGLVSSDITTMREAFPRLLVLVSRAQQKTPESTVVLPEGPAVSETLSRIGSVIEQHLSEKAAEEKRAKELFEQGVASAVDWLRTELPRLVSNALRRSEKTILLPEHLTHLDEACRREGLSVHCERAPGDDVYKVLYVSELIEAVRKTI